MGLRVVRCRSAVILMISKLDFSFNNRMIIDRIGLHSGLLPLQILLPGIPIPSASAASDSRLYPLSITERVFLYITSQMDLMQSSTWKGITIPRIGWFSYRKAGLVAHTSPAWKDLKDRMALPRITSHTLLAPSWRRVTRTRIQRSFCGIKFTFPTAGRQLPTSLQLLMAHVRNQKFLKLAIFTKKETDLG